MEKLFDSVRDTPDFRVEAVMFIRRSLHVGFVNVDSLQLDP